MKWFDSPCIFLFPYTTKRHRHVRVCVRRKYSSHIATVNITAHQHTTHIHIWFWFFFTWRRWICVILLGNILNGTADLHFNEQLLIWNLENFSSPKISYFLWKKLFDISFAQFLHLNPVFSFTHLLRCSNKQMSTVTFTSESSYYNKNKYGRLTE